MRELAFFTLSVLSGCSSLWGGQVTADPGSCTEEMRLCLGRNSLCPAPTDVALAEATLACGSSVCIASTALPHQYVADTIKVPASSGANTYGLDFDGDGKTENQYKTLVQANSVIEISLQDLINMQLAAGNHLFLFEMQASDLHQDLCVNLKAMNNSGSVTPKFDGSDRFVADPTTTASLDATLIDSVMTSVQPKNQTAISDAMGVLWNPLGGGNSWVRLHGVYITGTLTTRNGLPAISNGSMHGVISKLDIDNVIIPQYAQYVTSEINTKPMDSTTQTIISLFENMANTVSQLKCANSQVDCCKTNPTTCTILPEEVRISPVGGTFSPDLQVFDEAGAWKPVPGGKMRNGMSVGFGFTAIQAAF